MMRVIKVGGRPQADPSLAIRLAEVWASRATGDGLILVHGGGDEVTALQRMLGAVPTFVDGRRVTTATDIDVVRMALSGSANKRLVADLQSAGIPAIGLSGEDAALIGAAATDPDRLGHVGTPRDINASLLRLLMGAGYVPVVSPISRNVEERSQLGAALNVNGDDAAAAIAVAVGADELLLVSDVEGVMQQGAVVRQLSVVAIESMMAGGDVTGGMRAKLQAARVALEGGVELVRISDLAGIDDPSRGSTLSNDNHARDVTGGDRAARTGAAV